MASTTARWQATCCRARRPTRPFRRAGRAEPRLYATQENPIPGAPLPRRPMPPGAVARARPDHGPLPRGLLGPGHREVAGLLRELPRIRRALHTEHPRRRAPAGRHQGQRRAKHLPFPEPFEDPPQRRQPGPPGPIDGQCRGPPRPAGRKGSQPVRGEDGTRRGPYLRHQGP